MRRIRVTLAIAAGAIVTAIAAASCHQPGKIDPNSFDRHCASDSDCIVVDIPQDCCFGCGNLAINKKDEATYDSERQSVMTDCHGTTCPALDCVAVEAFCNAGTCDVCSGACAFADGGDGGNDGGDAGADGG